MINEYLIVFLLFTHWVADFPFQTDWMAVNKSTNFFALLCHIMTYGIITFSWVGLFVPSITTITIANSILWYVVINTYFHLMIDMMTSTWTSYLWKKGDRHNFFVVIGLDQFIHVTVLIFTARWMLI